MGERERRPGGLAGILFVAAGCGLGVAAAALRSDLAGSPELSALGTGLTAALAVVAVYAFQALSRAQAEGRRTRALLADARSTGSEEPPPSNGAAEHRLSQLQALARAALAIHSKSSIEEMLREVTEQARAIVGTHQSATSAILDQDWTRAVTSISLSDKYAAFRSYAERPTGEGIYSLVCRLNRPLRMTQQELESHPGWKGFGASAARHPPMRGWLAVPLVARDGRNIGLIHLSDCIEGEFTEEDTAVLVQLAQMAAIAIENHHLYEAARGARAEAEEANHIKDQFLATLSHELRTPLNAIQGWAQILRSGRLGPDGTERGLEAIERNSRAQAQLIGDLLDVSRVISGKLRLSLRALDPRNVVEAALATVLPEAEARGVAIERSFEAVPPIQGDPDRLQQVVWNLLSNAVKFTPSGGRVEVSVARAGEGVEIRVRDDGQGIAPELLPYVFDLFRQADGSSTQRQGGLGLGLAIARQLVELHGGSLRAESRGEGEGSTFSVLLPVAMSREEQPAGDEESEEEAGASRPRLAGLRVLAVDDDLDTLEVVAELLSLRGAEVVTAPSAAGALDVLGRFVPDVLVSDIGMPERDGYDLIRDIRGRGLGPDELPAVAVTAFAAPEDRRKALDAGFQVHLAKPVDPSDLMDVVARLGRREAAG